VITDQEFSLATQEFDKTEKRGSFYNTSVDLFDNGFEIESYILLLATWNFAAFRYAVKDFDIYGFRNTIGELNPCFDRMKNQCFKEIDFDGYKEDIKKIYATLSQIKGIKYTGASKVAHLKNREVFVMWDRYISGQESEKYYKELQIVRNNCWKYKRYKTDAEGYFQFLKDMQDMFGNIKFQHSKKTFAKAIDEFNFVNITLPIREMIKQEEKKKGSR